jgi:DNA-binding NarL/FixJ family response regulator
MEIRLVLADACGWFREGLGLIVGAESGMRVVGSAADGQAALQVVRKARPHVVVVEVALPVLNGIDLTRQLCEMSFPPKVLCLSSGMDSHHLSGVLSAGASGYLLKDHTAQDLIGAISAVAAGDVYLSPKVAGEVVAGYVASQRSQHASSRIMQLTSRERQVLQLVAEGIEGRAAAERLGVSPKTVYSHLEHVMQKLRARSIAELTKHAVREGITSL